MLDFRTTWFVLIFAKTYLLYPKLMYTIGDDGYGEERYHDATISLLGVFLKLELPKSLPSWLPVPYWLGFPVKTHCFGFMFERSNKKLSALAGLLASLVIEFPKTTDLSWRIGSWISYGRQPDEEYRRAKPVKFILSLFGIWIDLTIPLFKPNIVGKHKYGFSFHEDVIFLYYGVQHNDWVQDQKQGYTIYDNPVLHLEYLGRDHYDKHGIIFKTERVNENRLPGTPRETVTEFNQTPELIAFEFTDFDGTNIKGEAYTYMLHYRRFSGFLKPLGHIIPHKQFLKIDMDYKQEVGLKKGSWKGGTISLSFMIKPDASVHEEILKAIKADSTDATDIIVHL